jgi:hypothetical protein
MEMMKLTVNIGDMKMQSMLSENLMDIHLRAEDF